MLDILVRAGCYVAIIALGYILKRVGFFKDSDFPLLSKIVIRITLPCAIISSSAGMNVDLSMLAIILLGFGGGVIYMLFGYFMNLKAGKERQAFEVLNIPGYSIGTFTMPFAQGFLGSMGVLTTSLFDIGNAFVCLGGAYGVASSIKDGKGFDLKRIVKALATSIPFLTHLIVVIMNLLKIPFPAPVLSFAGIVGNANAFLAMLMIGVGFKLSGEKSQRSSILRILLVRYGVAAVLAVACWFLLPFSVEIRKALVILVFSPVGSAVPGFTAELKSDVGLSSAINSIAIVISIVIIVSLLLVMA